MFGIMLVDSAKYWGVVDREKNVLSRDWKKEYV